MVWLSVIYICLINYLGYQAMGNDKKRARKKKHRISEKTLWMIALLGGAFGTTVGMNKYRHKTNKFPFKYGLPLLTFLQLILFILIIIVTL